MGERKKKQKQKQIEEGLPFFFVLGLDGIFVYSHVSVCEVRRRMKYMIGES